LNTDFDQIIDRRRSNSIKWQKYPADVLPLWVADMDFTAPEPVLAALRESVGHGIFGYEFPTRELCETVARRMEKLYGWKVAPEMVTATPGVVAGFNIATHAACNPGQGILVQPPVYPPFLSVHKFSDLIRQDAPLKVKAEDGILRYRVDFGVFEQAFNGCNARTGMFLLCNPHNPTGQVFSRQDLVRMAEICLINNTIICSDEIHSEILLGGAQHIPIAGLSPEIADKTITLIAPSKTFNIAGLFCGFAIIPNPELMRHYKLTADQMSMHVNNMGLAGAKAAFSGECDEWLKALRIYLTGNRDFQVEYVKRELKGINLTFPEATYLAWLDCNEPIRAGKIHGSPFDFFLKQAKVALNDGVEFGSGGEGFVRLNFGCPRKTLTEALERMKAALG
jgi:cysteine-S-conjugate beta-lyase